MDQRRKVTIIVLIALTLFLGVGSLLVTQLIRNNQAPTDSAAAGFGENATKDLYSVVEEAFLNADCEYFLNREDLILDIPDNEGYDLWKNSEIRIYDIGSKVMNPKNCRFEIANTETILGLSLYTYNQYSQIDESAEDLYNRINDSFVEYVGGASYSNTESYIGFDPEYPNQCRINFFQTQNEFEYAALYIENFDCSSEANLPLLDSLSEIISAKLDNIVQKMNEAKANGIDSTQFQFKFTPRELPETEGESVEVEEVFN